MPIVPTSPDNIKVSYISQTKGVVRDVSIASANEYERLNPGTLFVFVNGDAKVKYLDIDGVNKLTTKDLGRTDPCQVGPQPCGPPTLHFFGGEGIGAEANPVVDSNGNLLAVDIVKPGFGYKTPPQIQVIDPCKNGKGAVLQTEINNGRVKRVVVLDTGFGYLPPPQTVPQYPALIKLTDVVVTNAGINYNCGVDKLTVTPNNGTVLSYECGAFGKITKVKVEKGGNFTELPRITMPSDQGLNARFVPVFDIIRDPFVPEVAPPSDVVQVFDLVGANITGYVDGKSYYGNVYFADGVKYAGTSAAGGTKIRVYDSRPESIKGTN
jgi:hypothetical protein|tara:strand:+ start:1848 stop:2819 length:972 start_codon:yes stop_codon:yes gene_type:complete